MPRPKYHVERTDDGVVLYSPLGEKIISTYTALGDGDELRYVKYIDLDLPDEGIGNNHDKLFECAIAAHEHLTTTRWRRFQYAAEDVLAYPAWAVIAAVAATIAAVGVFL